jgi:hypothetical protein
VTLRALAPALLSALALCAPAAALAAAAGPATVQSPDLWATVNACDTPKHPAGMGVRVSIPAHRDGEEQWVRIRVEWYNAATKSWAQLRSGGDTGYKHVGDGSGLTQAGTTFKFAAPAAGRYLIMRGHVNVQWRKHGKTRARASTYTMYGHASPTDPMLGVSHGACMITR